MNRHTESVGNRLIALIARVRAWRDASQLRRDDHAIEPWPAEQVADVARRVRAHVLAARMPVRCVDHPPDERRAPMVALLSQVIDSAAASGCAPFLDLAAAAGAGRELWDAECESWIALPFAERARGHYVALRISGDSMAPLMQSGDVVLVELGTRLARDTIVVAQRPDDGYVVKRVGAIGRTTVELLSLNPDFPAITIPRSEHLIVGTVIMRWSRERRV